jgi:hypothetical protein
MLFWLLGVAIFVVLLGALWKASPKGGIGALIGLGIAWFLSGYMTPYVTGMENIPLWLPPLPLAIVAVTLFVFGVIIWFRADKLPPPKQRATHDDHAHH